MVKRKAARHRKCKRVFLAGGKLTSKVAINLVAEPLTNIYTAEVTTIHKLRLRLTRNKLRSQ